MTRDDLATIGKLDDKALALLTTVEVTAIVAVMSERDAAFAQPAALKQQHADALAAKDAEHQASMDKLAADHAAALAAKEQEKAAAVAAEQLAVAKLQAEKEADAASHAAEKATLAATVAEQAKYVQAVSTLPAAKELAEALAKQRRLDELKKQKADAEAAKAAAEAELAKLGETVAEATKFVEAGPPDDKLGKDGDTWTDTVSGNVYEKVNGTWF